MPKQKRTQAKIECERRYKEKHKRIHLVFNSDKPEDSELLEWLRSQVESDRDIPKKIKEILQKGKNHAE